MNLALRSLKVLRPTSVIEVVLFSFVLVCLPLLFFGVRGILDALIGRLVWNLGHYFFFAAITYLVLNRCEGNSLSSKLKWVSLIIVFGGLIEFVQIFGSRSGDVADMIANSIGVLAVVCWKIKPDWRVWLGRIFFPGIIISHCLFVGAVAVWLYSVQHKQPELSNFESFDQRYQWRGRVGISNDYSSEGERSLKFYLSTRRYSGVSLVRFAKNWAGYEFLAFDLYNPTSTEIEMAIRVHDTHHRRSRNAFQDRFNLSITVAEGWNHYRIPLRDIQSAPATRVMDMENIQEVVLFSLGSKVPLTLYTDHFRLQ